MPKIIENIREQIIEEAKRQLFANGYGGTTIRSVAKACGVGIGTVYNYFPSKDMLISSFMLEDWKECTSQMRELDATDKFIFLEKIHNCLKNFTDKYRFLFNDKDASIVYSSVYTERHKQIREVIAEIIKPVCQNSSSEDVCFLSEHIAESILFWTLNGEPFEKQKGILKLLLEA